MKRPLDIYAIMQNIPQIMRLDGLTLKSNKWQGRYYINGQPHAWKKDKLRVWVYNGTIIVGEQGGQTMSLQKWLVEYGGCVDNRHAYEVLSGSRARLDVDIKLIVDKSAVGKYVDKDKFEMYNGYLLDNCNLFNYFCRLFGLSAAKFVFEKYKVTTDEHDNVVYWYVDIDGNICHDKVMRYKYDGHRDKTGGGWRKFTTADGYTNRCYFGAHLLAEREIEIEKVCTETGEVVCERSVGCPVYVVEGEKTAMMCRLVWPDAIFIATGGKNQLRDIDRDWILLPDIDAIEDWGEKGRISRWWEFFAAKEVEEHSDLGDMIEKYARSMRIGELQSSYKDFILQNV